MNRPNNPHLPVDPPVAILILNWNGWEDTIACIRSLYESKNICFQIIVIDNGSTDGSIEKIKNWTQSYFPRSSKTENREAVTFVEYTRESVEDGEEIGLDIDASITAPSSRCIIIINNKENLGFAAGNNVGIKYSLNRNFKYIMLLNNDTIVHDEAINNLYNFMQSHQTISACTPQIRFMDDQTIWNCGGFLTWYGSRKYLYSGTKVANVPQNGWKSITFNTGCAFFASRKIFQEIGLLTERFFFGEEDYEFSLRAKRNKKNMACCFNSIVLHKVGSSFQKKTTDVPLRNAYIYMLSRAIDLRSYWPRIIWETWRIMSLFYFLPLLKFKHHVSWKSLLKFGRDLLEKETKLQTVDRAEFEWARKKAIW